MAPVNPFVFVGVCCGIETLEFSYHLDGFLRVYNVPIL